MRVSTFQKRLMLVKPVPGRAPSIRLQVTPRALVLSELDAHTTPGI